jgi:ABC-type transport system involved in multi-copper enzyme maturation permease subunit
MAIHEQNYVRYDGPIREEGAGGIWTIGWTGFRVYTGFTRTKLIILLLWLASPIGATILVLIEYIFRGQVGQFGAEASAPDGGYVGGFLQLQAYSLAVLLMAAGCGVVAEDLRYRTFQLYFAKPISRLQYALGKFTAIFLLGSLVTLVPSIIVGSLRAALFVQTDFFKDVLLQIGIGIGLSAFLTLVMCLIVMGLSSLTARTGYVVLSWIALLLVPAMLSGILALAVPDSDINQLVSITGNFGVLADWLLVEEFEFEGPKWVAPLVLSVLAALGATATTLRIRRLEGVA